MSSGVIRHVAASRLMSIRCYLQQSYRYISTTSPVTKYSRDTIQVIVRDAKDNRSLFGKIVKNPFSVEEPAVPKKRGRPKKIKDESDDVEPKIPKKRGRPKKIQVETEEMEPKIPKKRGRPKKVTETTHATELETVTNLDVLDDKPSVQFVDEKVDNSRQSMKENVEKSMINSTGIVTDSPSEDMYVKTDNSVDLNTGIANSDNSSTLNAIKSFPFFPPSRSEYFVRPIKKPDIYIPTYTERSKWENPYFPSVGTILNATLSTTAQRNLKKWKDDLIKKLGEEGFEKHHKAILSRGIDFHEAIERYLMGVPVSDIKLKPSNAGYWESAQPVLKDISDVHATEKTVIHRDLCYKGIFDCVANYRNHQVMIEWKTSTRTKANIAYTYDNPVQLAAYTGAYNLMPDQDKLIDKAMLVICYEDGQPAHTHMMSRNMCIEYWTQWLLRLHLYWLDKTSV